ncbi:MAG: alkaline phosphatase [Gemmatimonadota bacterium]|nr:alkaline phosphatase [Gemmatimonadota bacterium]
MSAVVVGVGLVGACASARGTPTTIPSEAPPRIILFIGDGVGLAYWTAARFAADALTIDAFPVVGLVDVQPDSGRIPDSAASATAYAAGIKTYNGAIGVGPDSLPVVTVLEVAAERGMGTGLVATSRITHATPASFAAHVPSRQMEWEIARQMVAQRPTVVLGGGAGVFDGRLRPDSVDLLGLIAANYAFVETAEALVAVQLDTVQTLFGLFGTGHMPPAAARTPTLAEMTAAALTVLDKNPRGFFLMVEASQPDWRGHGNQSLEDVTAEMLDFDRAIGEALAYQGRRSETLIVVTSDHETGGLALQYDSTGTLHAAYTTGGHTATMIPLFAGGPGAELFGGVTSNDRVGRELLALVRR